MMRSSVTARLLANLDSVAAGTLGEAAARKRAKIKRAHGVWHKPDAKNYGGANVRKREVVDAKVKRIFSQKWLGMESRIAVEVINFIKRNPSMANADIALLVPRKFAHYNRVIPPAQKKNGAKYSSRRNGRYVGRHVNSTVVTEIIRRLESEGVLKNVK